MNSYENEILRLQKRLKRIEENPDPRMLKTNKMLYELEIDALKAALQAWREGKPLADGVPLYTLFRSMGFTASWRTMSAMQTTDASKYFDFLRSHGLPENACDMTSVPMAMAMSGDMPRESLGMATNGVCVPALLEWGAQELLLGVPTFHLDVGFRENQDYLQYVTTQLGEFIEFAEWKVPGIKFDEDRLIELQEMDQAYFGYYRDIYQLLKRNPSPIGGRDVFRYPRPPANYPEPAKAVTFLRARRDEVIERADKGVGTVPEEKLRMMWTVSGPYFMDPFEVLAKWGVVVPFYYAGVPFAFGAPIPQPTYGGDEGSQGSRRLSPLQVEASKAMRYTWSGLGSRWVDNLIWICRDLKIDAIINYCMRGCSATLGLRKLVQDTAEKQLDIPTLQLEGRQLQAERSDDQDITARLDDFARTCLIRKGFAPVRVGD